MKYVYFIAFLLIGCSNQNTTKKDLTECLEECSEMFSFETESKSQEKCLNICKE